MADTKVSALTALGAAPASNDLLYVVDVSAGASKSMTVANLFTSPTFVTPALGTPASGVATNLTGTATALNIGGNAATATALQTTRAIYGNNFDGTAALTQVIASTYGGTGNGFTKFTGPTTAEKTFTLPDSSETLLYAGGPLGTPSSGVATNLTGTATALNIGGNAATATTATNATNIAITDDTSTNATMYPTWVTANTGNLPAKVSSTKFTLNPSTGAFNATTFGGIGKDLTTARISGSTYSTVQHIQDLFHSAGWTSGGTINDAGSGLITVDAGTGLIRATDSDVATIYFTDFPASSPANVTLTDGQTNYVYVEYNAGSPRVIATTTPRTDYNTNFQLGQVYRDGTTLHINQTTKSAVSDHAGKMIRFNQEVMPYAHVSGAALAGTGTRNISLTAGAFWEGLIKFSTNAFDSSGADRFVYYYYNGSAWVAVTAQSQIDNTQYNNLASGLATLTANRYGVHWVYLATDSHVYVVYGEGDYTLTQAQDAMPPSSLPSVISSHAFLAGKIIIQKSASSFTQVEGAFHSAFTPALATDHATLTNLSWTASGHTGTLSTLAGFNSSNVAAVYSLSGTGTEIPTTTAPTFNGAVTLAENASIALDSSLSADGKWSGITDTGTSGEALAFGDIITLADSSGKWFKADISAAVDADADARNMVAVCLSTAGGADSAITILLRGKVRADANFPALTVGKPVYISTTGDITQTQPTTTDHVIRIIGHAVPDGLSATAPQSINFNPDNRWTTHT